MKYSSITRITGLLSSLFLISMTGFAQGTQLHSGHPIYSLSSRIGIGTANPTTAPLHISANTNLVQLRLERTGSSSGISADIGGHSGHLIFYPGGYPNKNGNVYFNTTGKIGIGTEAPEDILHIFSPAANGSRKTSLLIDGYSQSTLVDGSSQVIRFKGNAERYWGAIGGYTANSKEGMGIFAGSSTSLTATPGIYLNSDQNVGIGTTSPNYRMDVAGQYATNFFDSQLHLHTTNNTYGMFLGSHSANYGVISQGGHYYSAGSFRARSNYSSGIVQNNGYIHLYSNSGLTSGNTFTPNFRMTVSNNGNVGIGTTSPNAKLEVMSDGAYSGGAELRLQHANNNTNDVVSTVNFANNAGSVAMIQGGTVGGNNNGYITFFTDNAGASNERLRINPEGKVGIGTTTPYYPLSVAGRINSEANGDYYGAWFGGEARTADPSINVGEWHNYRGSIYWDNSDRKMVFETMNSTLHANTLVLEDGNVGIGVGSPGEKLEVNGTIRSKKVKVEATGWPDYVFAKSYDLRTLVEVEDFIKTNQHLPDVPSAKEIEANGLDLGNMDATLLKKVEELTLYMIEMKKEIEILKMENKKLSEEVDKVKK